jgi:hypothetical protein
MTPPVELQAPGPPSLATLAKTTAVALVVAGVVLLTIVLPAEYAIDPIGTGRLLGLTQIAAPPVIAVDAPRPAGATALVPIRKGTLGEYSAEYKVDAVELTLGPYEYVEYKYHLENGATMLYSWTASAPLIHDFHGAADGAVSGAEQSFDKQNRGEAKGSFTAPFSGIHGWYWENPGTDTVVVKLTSAGFYASAVEIRSDHTRRPHPLKSPEKGPVAAEATSASSAR